MAVQMMLPQKKKEDDTFDKMFAVLQIAGAADSMVNKAPTTDAPTDAAAPKDESMLPMGNSSQAPAMQRRYNKYGGYA